MYKCLENHSIDVILIKTTLFATAKLVISATFKGRGYGVWKATVFTEWSVNMINSQVPLWAISDLEIIQTRGLCINIIMESCDDCIYGSVCVCLSVRKYTCIFGTTRHVLAIFFCVFVTAVDRSYRLAITSCTCSLWMTSYLHIMDTRRRRVDRYCCRESLRHYVVVCRLTPLLRRIGCVLSWTTAVAETRRLHRARGAGGGACNAP